ncbi:MAG: hypothetical protein JO001_13285 [Alphaproteobacteria bacterium]|nr:hypothetical protein [Alphaproteobacteria bacterium]
MIGAAGADLTNRDIRRRRSVGRHEQAGRAGVAHERPGDERISGGIDRGGRNRVAA